MARNHARASKLYISHRAFHDRRFPADSHSMIRRSTLAWLMRVGAAMGILASAAFGVSQSQVDQDLMSMNPEDLSRVKVFSASRHF